MRNYDSELEEKFKTAYLYDKGIAYLESRDKCGLDDEEDEGFIDNDFEIDEDLDYDEKNEVAFKMYRELEEVGFEPVYSFLGDFYYIGKGGAEEDCAKAETYYLKSIDCGYPKAKECLGVLYSDEDSGYYFPNKAAKWYSEAADEGNEMAKFSLAKLAIFTELESFSTIDGVVMLTELSEDDVYYAQEALGIIYYEGKYVENDYEQAVDYLSKACEFCEAPDAQAYLAACYYCGLGCDCDVEKAVTILLDIEDELESDKDYADYNAYGICCYYLALAYADGVEGVVDQDKAKSVEYLKISAESGNKEAKELLQKQAPVKKPSRLSFLKKL